MNTVILRPMTRAVAVVALSVFAFGASAAEWETKVEPELLVATERGQRSEFMVYLEDQADLSGAAREKTRVARSAHVMRVSKAAAARSQPKVLALMDARKMPHRSFWISNAISTRGTRADIEALALRSEVASIHRVLPSGKLPVIDDAPAIKAEAIGIEPSLTLLRVPEVWALGFRGQGVVVGDHDIGVKWDHPALINKYRGWDGASADHAYNWLNAFPVDPFCMDTSVPCDPHGHGTHTTGTMVGDDGEGNQVGMAPDAQWIACRSLLDPPVGVGTVPTYMICMEWTIAPYPSGDTAAADPAKAPDVVNNSWGCLEACAPPILKATNDAIKAAGIVQVASAGNEGSECSTIVAPPAVYESSFTVGASNNEDAMAGFSSRGPVLSDLSMRLKPNVVAPGVGTLSSWNDGSYNSISGTSMAAPHVAGLVALIMSAEPRLIGRVDDIRSLIEKTAVKIMTAEVCGGTGQDDIPNNIFGYGRIDALAAVLGRPQLALATSSPKANQYDFTATESEAAKLEVSNVVMTLNLPAGQSVAATSEPPASSEPSADGSMRVQFARAQLTPAESWTVSVELTPTTTPAAISSSVEADQVSPVAGAPGKTAAVKKEGYYLGGRFGGALGLGLLLALGSVLLLRVKLR